MYLQFEDGEHAPFPFYPATGWTQKPGRTQEKVLGLSRCESS